MASCFNRCDPRDEGRRHCLICEPHILSQLPSCDHKGGSSLTSVSKLWPPRLKVFSLKVIRATYILFRAFEHTSDLVCNHMFKLFKMEGKGRLKTQHLGLQSCEWTQRLLLLCHGTFCEDETEAKVQNVPRLSLNRKCLRFKYVFSNGFLVNPIGASHSPPKPSAATHQIPPRLLVRVAHCLHKPGLPSEIGGVWCTQIIMGCWAEPHGKIANKQRLCKPEQFLLR